MVGLRSSLCVLLSLVVPACAGGAPRTTPAKAATALASQFETIFYSNAEVLRNSKFESVPQEDVLALRPPFAYLLAALDSIGSEVSAAILGDSEAVLVGAKSFAPPVGLGPVHSISCYLILPENGSGRSFGKYFHRSIASMSGVPIWGWQAKLGEFGERDSKPSSLYALQVAQSYLLICNDLTELRSIAERLTDSEHSDANTSPEWSSISRHEIWGFRRYEPAAMVHSDAAGTADVTSTAQALTFFVDVKTQIAVVRLSAVDNSTAEKVNASMERAKAALQRFKQSGTGTWETTIPLVHGQTAPEAIFDAMGLFGFGIYP